MGRLYSSIVSNQLSSATGAKLDTHRLVESWSGTVDSGDCHITASISWRKTATREAVEQAIIELFSLETVIGQVTATRLDGSSAQAGNAVSLAWLTTAALVFSSLLTIVNGAHSLFGIAYVTEKDPPKPATRDVLAGQDYDTQLEIRNASETTANIRLTYQKLDQATIRIDPPEQPAVAPGQSVIFRVVVNRAVDKTQIMPIKQPVVLEAHGANTFFERLHWPESERKIVLPMQFWPSQLGYQFKCKNLSPLDSQCHVTVDLFQVSAKKNVTIQLPKAGDITFDPNVQYDRAPHITDANNATADALFQTSISGTPFKKVTLELYLASPTPLGLKQWQDVTARLLATQDDH